MMAVATGRKAVDAATEHQPDVAVLDLNMPDGDGLRPAPGGGVSHACAHPHHVRRRRERTRRAPSRGVRLHAQGVGPDEIVAAVRAVARGEALFGAGIAARCC